jgi:tetratricopeptide (TPR) repeat protein
LRQAGKLTEAEELLQRTLRIKETAFGPEDVRVTQALSLRDFYRVQSNFSAAEPILIRALSILDAVPNATSDDRPHTMLQLADLYSALERYTEMDDLYQRILPLFEEHWDNVRL